MITVFLLACYTVMSVLGLILLKMGAPALRQVIAGEASWAPLLVGAFLYLAAFAVWIVILTKIDLSIAYPVAIGLTLLFLSLASALVLKEAIGVARLIGIVLIFAGIVLIGRAP